MRNIIKLSTKSSHMRLFGSFAENALDTKKTAVVFIEYQNEFASEGGKLHGAVKAVMDKNNMLKKSAELAAYARGKGVKIIHAPITFTDDYKEIRPNGFGILANIRDGGVFKASEWGGAFCKEMTPSEEDIIVHGKRGLCGFASTNLEFILRQNNIETVILGGFLTNCCVESTMRVAYEKGFNVITLTDGTAAASIEQQEAACKFNYPMFSVPMTVEEVMKKI